MSPRRRSSLPLQAKRARRRRPRSSWGPEVPRRARHWRRCRDRPGQAVLVRWSPGWTPRPRSGGWRRQVRAKRRDVAARGWRASTGAEPAPDRAPSASAPAVPAIDRAASSAVGGSVTHPAAGCRRGGGFERVAWCGPAGGLASRSDPRREAWRFRPPALQWSRWWSSCCRPRRRDLPRPRPRWMPPARLRSRPRRLRWHQPRCWHRH